MKQTFKTNAELIHKYFQFDQSHGRAGNVFFDGPSLYSYGRHFELARKLSDGTLLINTRTYSVSTSKHQSITFSAVNRSKIERVIYLDFGYGTWCPSTCIDRHLGACIRLFNEWDSKGRKGFKALEKIAFHLKELAKVEKIGAYTVDYKKLPFVVGDVLNELDVRKSFQTRINEKRAKTIQTAKERTEKENLSLWLAGKFNGAFYHMQKIYLRRKGEFIETTRGARVPLNEALSMLAKIRKGEDVTGQKIGAYTVDQVTLDNIRIGCHVIEFQTINELLP